MLQGWPCNAESPTSLQDHRGILNKVAGIMFTSSVILTVFVSTFYSVPWTRSASQSAGGAGDQDEDAKAAMAAFARLARGTQG